MTRRSSDSLPGDPDARIAALVDAHGPALERTARHHSLCADDAHDAMQRALEIYLRRLETVEPASEGAWMKVVVRHEAMAVRRARSESVAGEELDLEAQADGDGRPVEDRLFGAERSARSAEALRRLKPDEARALVLKAEGLSYAEIGERHGWTYTKTNRSITEGRRRFLRAYAELEAKDACEAFADGLVELARGTASAERVLSLRPHLRHCPACRATVRELRGGRRRIAVWLPLPPVAWLARPRPRRGQVLDREANLAEAGLGAVDSPGRWAELKLQLHGLLQRLSGSDLATGAQIAAASGGGRATSVAALIGMCLSGVGAGTYCVATLVLPAPERRDPVVREAQERPRPERPKRAFRPATDPPVQRVVVSSTPTPTPSPARTPAPVRRRPERKPAAAAGTPASVRRASASVASSPPPAPVAPGQQEYAFEQSAPPSGAAAQSAPAAAPAAGGGEFTP